MSLTAVKAFQITIRNVKSPLAAAYVLDELGHAAQVTSDGSAIYYWNLDRGVLPNLCDIGVVEIEVVEL